MIDNTSRISLTYTLRGESLATAGVYESAKVSKIGDKYITKEQMVIIAEPVYKSAKQTTILSNSFVLNSLERPKKPHKSEGQAAVDAYFSWGRMSDNAKLNYAIEKYVEDLEGSNPEWELI